MRINRVERTESRINLFDVGFEHYFLDQLKGPSWSSRTNYNREENQLTDTKKAKYEKITSKILYSSYYFLSDKILIH